MDDVELRQNVLDELEFEPSIDAANIGVTAKDGVVTLMGHVPSYAEKIIAERAARRVNGVRAIAQDIEVRYLGDKKTADDEIAKRALSILKWDAIIPQNSIEVTVQKGWVTLAGDVTWQYQRRAAEDAIWKLSGVTGVTNKISIQQSVRKADVKKQIEGALGRHAQVEAEAIRINVFDGNKVLIEGNVESWAEREAVRDAVWSVAGVQLVDDRLTIGR